jgi:TetR/AcrR family tetracycline transcriptional repressor
MTTSRSRERQAAVGTAGSTRHAGIERDDVIDAALELVATGGGGALTMRKLAAELGVATTTIYWHVGNREDLVLAVVQRQAERQAATKVRGTTPDARITSAARNIWDNALAHRNVTALASQAGATTLLELPLEIALVAELETAGLRGEAARDGLRAVLACVAGFLIVAWRREEQVPDQLRPAALWAAVDDGRLGEDTLAAMSQPTDLDALFDSTLAAIVDGLLAGTIPPAPLRTTRTPR